MANTVKFNRCLGCMKELGDYYICPHCGIDNETLENSGDALHPGFILKGRYLIGKVLGKGGFGITYIGYDLMLNKQIAIKEYFPMDTATRDGKKSGNMIWKHESQRQEGCEIVFNEARKMEKMGEIPAIVRVRDTFVANNTAYIIMDYVEGQTLKARLKEKGVMTYKECVNLLMPIMDGLTELHKQGMIHRDISPDNIMVRSDGSVRLLDLGAAKDIAIVRGNASTKIITKTGFSPLEQYSSRSKVGPWTDVYALCATIYYCITGKVLPDAMDRMENDEIVFSPEVRKKLPSKIIKTLKSGLAVEADKRIQSVEELKKRLKINIWKNIIPAAVGVAAAAFAIVMVMDMTKVRVEELGHTNANGLNGSTYLSISEQYTYLVGTDDDLYIIPYNVEDQTFYIDEATKLYDDVAFLSMGKEYIYFISDRLGSYEISKMRHDGTEIETIYLSENRKITDLQYIKFSNEKEYLYFTMEKEADEIELNSELWRYDLSTDKADMLRDDVFWYNVYGEAIYLTSVSYQKEEGKYQGKLFTTDFEGAELKVLDTKNVFSAGFVENDTLFLFEINKEALVAYTLDGKEKEDTKELAKMSLDYNYNIGYGDGWLYYVSKNDQGIRRVREDGTGDASVAEGKKFMTLCYEGNFIYYWDEFTDEYGNGMLAYFAYKDGSDAFETGTVSERVIVEDIMLSDVFEYTLNSDGTGVILTGYTGEAAEVKIPAFIDGLPVVTIAEYAFSEKEIVKVHIPDTVEVIEEKAFFDCQILAEVRFSQNLHTVGFGAFGQCYELEQIRLPQSVKVLEDLAFADSYIQAISIGENVEKIGRGAFAEKYLADFTAFEVDLYNSNYVELDGVLFTKDMSTLVACPSGIGNSYTIPNGVTRIDEYAFAHCKGLTNLVIPDSVKTIGESAFFDCEELKKISISSDCVIPTDLGEEIMVERY